MEETASGNSFFQKRDPNLLAFSGMSISFIEEGGYFTLMPPNNDSLVEEDPNAAGLSRDSPKTTTNGIQLIKHM